MIDYGHGDWAIDARTSSDLQRKNETISSQLDFLRAYAGRTGARVVAEHIDDGVSGTFLDRPGLNDLVEQAKKGLLRGVLVTDLDRLGRVTSWRCSACAASFRTPTSRS